MTNNVNKKVRNATIISYKDYKFKSKLEFYCFKQLEDNGLIFEYEKYKFILLDKFIFKNTSIEGVKSKGNKLYTKVTNNIRAMRYTPDFVNLEDGWIIETKGRANDAWPLRLKLFKKYINDNNLNYNIYIPRTKKQVDETIELIKAKYYNNKK